MKYLNFDKRISSDKTIWDVKIDSKIDYLYNCLNKVVSHKLTIRKTQVTYEIEITQFCISIANLIETEVHTCA